MWQGLHREITLASKSGHGFASSGVASAGSPMAFL